VVAVGGQHRVAVLRRPRQALVRLVRDLHSISPPEGHDQAVLEHMRSALGTPV
jgi:hypothetical protein